MSFARWWTMSLGRHALLGGAALGFSACWGDAYIPDAPPARASATEFDQQLDAIDLQRQRGWHVGTEATYLDLPGATDVDVGDTDAWRSLAVTLPSLLAPKSSALVPFYVPTLFQAWTEPAAADLRAAIEPIFTSAMRDSNLRARALVSLLEDARWPSDLAVIVDLPGPESVAVAAQLADHLDPIFTFGNWPHPVGVVPAHETLAASLYYATQLAQARSKRPDNAPPLFVLDANRLAPYSEEMDAFDNRYTARLPTAAALKRLGYRRVLYINESGSAELDDLNDEFVDLQQNGIDVRMMALSEIEASDIAPLVSDAPEVKSTYWVPFADAWLYWGGSAHAHHCFWNTLGWPYGHHEPSSLEMRALAPVPTPSSATSWRPQARPTMFSSGLANAGGFAYPHRPQGFGAMTARVSRSTGHLVAMAGGRSGSFGRGGGSHGG